MQVLRGRERQLLCKGIGYGGAKKMSTSQQNFSDFSCLADLKVSKLEINLQEIFVSSSTQRHAANRNQGGNLNMWRDDGSQHLWVAEDTVGMLCLLSLPLFLFTTDYSTARQLPQLALPQECLSVSDQGLLASDSPVERKIRPMEWLAGGLFASQTSVRTSQKGLKASQTVMRTIQKAMKISQNSDQ